MALALFLLYPYAFYLYGAVYADALFVLAALGALLLLEADHVWLAGLAGAVATAARPVALVVVVGLAVRALERRGVFPQGRVLTAGSFSPLSVATIRLKGAAVAQR